MAVTFRRGPQRLIEKIKQAGFRIADVTSDIGDPNRSLQISLQNGVVVNWDRDSYCVWAQGPEPLSEKIEAHLASRRRGQRSQNKASRIFLWGMLALLVGLLIAIAQKKEGSSQAQPPRAAPVEVSGG